MKKSLLLITASLVIFAACKKENNTTPPATGPTARAMFVHTVLSGDSLRVKINDTIQSSIPGFTFLNNTGYKNVRAGNAVKATIYFPVSSLTLVETTQSLTVNSSYSYFLCGASNAADVVFKQDNLSTPASGKAKVRFANLSIDNMLVDCYVGASVATPKVESSIPYKTVTDFREIDAGSNFTVIMNQKDTFTLKGELLQQSILAGKIYTFVLSGTRNGSGTAALKLTSIANN